MHSMHGKTWPFAVVHLHEDMLHIIESHYYACQLRQEFIDACIVSCTSI